MKKDILGIISSILFGVIVTKLTDIIEWFYEFIVNHFSVRLTIEATNNEMYSWVHKWLSAEVKNKKKILVSTKESDSLRDPRPKLVLSPSEGHYFIKWQNIWLSIVSDKRVEKDPNEYGYISRNSKGKEKNVFSIRAFTQDLNKINEFLLWVRNQYADGYDGEVKVKVPSFESWETACILKPRPIDSVILDEGHIEALLNDIEWFQNSEDFYLQRGIPYRRGYLLYGPAGNGKTSVVAAIAGHLGLPLNLLSLSDGNVHDRSLKELLMSVNKHSVVLIEDVDCATINRQKKSKKDVFMEDMMEGNSIVTLSGLLNAIDGILAGSGRILVMTTNHREKLDPALIRPGRVDFELEITNATSYQIQKMFLRFFPKDIELAETFSIMTPNKSVSMAHLQKYLMKCKVASEAVNGCEDFLKKVDSY